LFDEAMKLGLLDEEGHIFKPDENSIAETYEACAAVQALIDSFETNTKTSEISALVCHLKEVRDISRIPTKSQLRNDGYCRDMNDRLRILKDYFVSSPAFHESVRANIQKLRSVSQVVDELLSTLEKRV
jgi:hypothetical protein